MDAITAGLAGDHPLRAHLLGSAPYMRLFVMGAILLVVMRFSPRAASSRNGAAADAAGRGLVSCF